MKWAEASLGSIVRFVGGGTPSKARPEFWQGPIPWVSPKDMLARDVWDSRDHINESAVAASATQVVPIGSVLIVVRSGILAHTLPIGIARVSLSINQDLKALSPTIDSLSNEYLAYFLQARSRRVLRHCVKRGPTVHSVDVEKLSQIPVPLPPLSEQRRIVEILDQADALRKKRAEADAKAERILSALFYKMFGDPATNPMGWPTGTLDKIIIETKYGTSARAANNGHGIAVIRMNNITSAGTLDLTDLKYVELDENEEQTLRLEPGDILFNRTNSRELVGKTALWDAAIAAVPASYLIRVRVDQEKVFPEYVWAYMNSRYIKNVLFERARRAIGMANINAQELRGLPFMKPSKERQEEFVRGLSSIEPIIQRQHSSRERMHILFSALLSQAFSGELTAKWRETHMEELLVEMQAQHDALERMENELQSIPQ
jgi:type I restriction enzyme S subunit